MVLACPWCTVIPYFDDVYLVGFFVALSGFFYGIVICGKDILRYIPWEFGAGASVDFTIAGTD